MWKNTYLQVFNVHPNTSLVNSTWSKTKKKLRQKENEQEKNDEPKNRKQLSVYSSQEEIHNDMRLLHYNKDIMTFKDKIRMILLSWSYRTHSKQTTSQ